MKTDIQKTLQTLREHPKGIHSFDLNRIVGTTRSAARINDLKRLGYHIDSRQHVKMGNSWGAVYTLIETTKPEMTWITYENEQGYRVSKQVPVGEQLHI